MQTASSESGWTPLNFAKAKLLWGIRIKLVSVMELKFVKVPVLGMNPQKSTTNALENIQNELAYPLSNMLIIDKGKAQGRAKFYLHQRVCFSRVWIF